MELERALTINAAGIGFHARQLGAQPRAVFLHGFGGDLHTWDSMWPLLDDELPALRYDQRGFGQSVESSQPLFSHADDLLAILGALNIERCDLVGVSMGGAIALNFALDHPERVQKLILISPGMVAWEWSDAWRALWRAITHSCAGRGNGRGAPVVVAASALCDYAKWCGECGALSVHHGVFRCAVGSR